SGVRLKDVRRDWNRLTLEIDAEEDITYTTQFIGTCKGFEKASQPGELPPKSSRPVTRRYSPDIGAVLAEVNDPYVSYQLKGNEIYVRAKIISSKPKSNPWVAGEVETAWTQPVVPRR